MADAPELESALKARLELLCKNHVARYVPDSGYREDVVRIAFGRSGGTYIKFASGRWTRLRNAPTKSVKVVLYVPVGRGRRYHDDTQRLSNYTQGLVLLGLLTEADRAAYLKWVDLSEYHEADQDDRQERLDKLRYEAHKEGFALVSLDDVAKYQAPEDAADYPALDVPAAAGEEVV